MSRYCPLCEEFTTEDFLYCWRDGARRMFSWYSVPPFSKTCVKCGYSTKHKKDKFCVSCGGAYVESQ